MDALKWQNIKDAMSAALDLPESERADFLARVPEAEIRDEVEKLLAAHADAGEFIDKPLLIEQGVAEDDTTDSLIGVRIENYSILERIGAGGMGAVYLAERINSDFTQKVALKLIKRGMDSETILKRFAAERRILSTLKHPNIAQLIDGGIAREGLPFFVMEFVDGKQLNEFCRENNLSLEARLKIFGKICAAVEYAHQNLVVHRDLKPSNILVTTDGTPKLLDFGIAKLLSDEDAETTATQAKMFTPEYASPEQILGKTVTTATDVYSLGVILYELLSGHRPFETKGKSYEEIIKSVCDTEPARPSAWISDFGFRISDFGNTASGNNQTTLREATISPKSQIPNPKLLRGDLDNIILKALRKEPSERYGSVRQLTEDISRFLGGLPVLARPQTLKYRFGKFVKRHKAGVFAAALVLLSLVGGISVAGWQTIVARREREKADRRFAEVRSIAKNVIFDYHDAITKLPRSTEVRERMVRDSVDFLNNLMAEDESSPELLEEIAAGYEKVAYVQSNIYESNLSRVDAAIDNYRKALAIRQSLVRSDPQNADRKFALAVCYGQTANSLMARGREPESLVLYQNALEIYESLFAAAPAEAKIRSGLAQGYFDLGFVNFELRETLAARAFYEKSLAIREGLFAEEPQNMDYARNLAIALKRLGQVFDKDENYADSIELYRRAAQLDEERLKLLPDDAQTKRDLSVSYRAISFNLKERKQFAPALEYSQKSLDLLLELSAIDPLPYQQNIAQAYRLLGEVKSAAGEFEKAIAFYKQSVTVGETLAANYNGDFKQKTNLTIVYENLAAVYEKMSVQKRNPEFHRQGCRELQRSLTLWEEIQTAKKLLRWEETALKRIRQNLEKCP
jgi:non-specific serine/threonine protein kinase/serine/threonine-protein kinase